MKIKSVLSRVIPMVFLAFTMSACQNSVSNLPDDEKDDVDNRLPALSVSPVSTAEGDDGTKELTFTISLNFAGNKDVTVDYATADDSASAGSDYEATSGTATIPKGSTSTSVDVNIMGDTDVESDETFNIVLSNPVNASIATAEAAGNIGNDDAGNDNNDNVFVVTGSCVPSDAGTDYPVGPGQRYSTISDVPWNSLGPGDTVRIFYRAAPYKEKIIISTDGTGQNPIRVCGVPGPNGERPILDGDGATNDPDDSNAYSTYAPMEGLAMILLYNRDYDLKVSNITIDGLHIKNAKSSFSYTRTDGQTVENYESGAACIRVQAGDNIVIRNNELENCGNGIFTMSQEYNEASLTRNILIEGNYLHGHGQPGSYREHAVYIQAIGATYQYNRFGPNAVGAGGSTLKERVAGSVIRYNWFDSGSSRVLDLVEVEDAAPWYLVSEYLAELGCSSVNNCPNIDQDRLQKVQAADAAYRKNYVYGNFFDHIGSQTEAGNIVHYGSDNDEALSHKGTLYFYNNTVSIRQDQDDSWRFRLFYLGNRDATTNSEETAEVFNNIIYFAPENIGATPAYFCWDETNRGTFNLGVNWFNADWNNPSAITSCYYDGSDPQPVITGADNLLDTTSAPIPINLTTLAPNDISSVRNQAQPLPDGAVSGYPVTGQYVPHLGKVSRSSADDLGAAELP